MSPRFTRVASIFVWLAWAALTFYAVDYVTRYGSKVLFQDDLVLTYVWVNLGPFVRPLLDGDLADAWANIGAFLREVWSQHNEHRIPLPRIIYWALFAISYDVRYGCWFSVLILAAISAAMIVAAKRWRGHTSPFDAVFPLLWLHVGNAENLLMGFQLSLMLPTALVCAIVLISISRARAMLPRDAWICSASLVGLPLCGGPGMLQAPLLALWLAVVGWNHVRSTSPITKRAGRVLLAGVVLTGIVGLLYMLGFHYPEGSHRNSNPALIVGLAMRVLSLALGPAGETWWPWSATFVVAFSASAALVAMIAWRSRTNDRWRVAAVLVALTTSAALAFGIGYGRGGADENVIQGFANRYVGLPAPILCSAYFGWILFGPRLGRTLAQGVLAILFVCANYWVNTPYGIDYGARKRDVAVAFEKDVKQGVNLRLLASLYSDWMDIEKDRLVWELQHEIEFGFHPFGTYPEWARDSARWPMFELTPTLIEGPMPTSERYLGGKHPALMITDGTKLTFDISPRASKFVGTYGVLDGVWKAKSCPSVRIAVFEFDPDGRRWLRYERLLDPKNVETDRGPQRIMAEFEPSNGRHVKVVVAKGDPKDTTLPWLWIRELSFE